MKELIKHLWKHNQEEIVSKSYLHWHGKNVHSIVLFDNEEKSIRLYIADIRNELFYNYPDNYNLGQMPIPFQRNPCDMTVECIKGKLTIWRVEESDEGIPTTKFIHPTFVENSFEKVGPAVLKTIQHISIASGESMEIESSHIHTLSCAPNSITAWFVYEGKRNPEYKMEFWSNKDLEKENREGLYKKPSALDVERLLTACDLL